jgi:hypothetical protein
LVWEVGQILELRVRGADKGSAIDGMAYFWAHDKSTFLTMDGLDNFCQAPSFVID